MDFKKVDVGVLYENPAPFRRKEKTAQKTP